MIIKEEGIQLSMLILVLLLCKVEMIFDLIFSTITPLISCLYLFSYNREKCVRGTQHSQGTRCKQLFLLLSMMIIQGMKLVFFVVVGIWLLNSSKWQPIQKSLLPFSKTNKTFFPAVSVLDRPSKIKLRKRSLTCDKMVTRMDDIQCSSSP